MIVGLLMAGERQIGAASPTLAQAFGASLAGLAGAWWPPPLAARFASARRRMPRLLGPGAAAVGVSWLVVSLLFGPTAVGSP